MTWAAAAAQMLLGVMPIACVLLPTVACAHQVYVSFLGFYLEVASKVGLSKQQVFIAALECLDLSTKTTPVSLRAGH